MSVKLLTDLELLSLIEGCTGRLSLHLSNVTLLEITCHGTHKIPSVHL